MPIDDTLPWKYYKEIPNFIKEFPEILGEGSNILTTKVIELKKMIINNDIILNGKNRSRERVILGMIYNYNTLNTFNTTYNNSDIQDELVDQFKGDCREKVIDSIYCPHVENIGDFNIYVFHSMARDWMNYISNIRISKFQFEEDVSTKKMKKKKKKVRRRKDECILFTDSIEKSNSNIRSAPVSKTIGDEDTNCENTPNDRSSGKYPNLTGDGNDNELHFDDNKMRVESSIDETPIQTNTSNLIKKKVKILSKEEIKKEKKRLKRLQKHKAAKMKKLARDSQSDSLESCSSVKKASCLSVAGSGVTKLSKEKINSKPANKHQYTENLIIKHNPFVFEDEVVKTEIRNKCSSLCSGEESHTNDINHYTSNVRASSLDIKQDIRSTFELIRKENLNRITDRGVEDKNTSINEATISGVEIISNIGNNNKKRKISNNLIEHNHSSIYIHNDHNIHNNNERKALYHNNRSDQYKKRNTHVYQSSNNNCYDMNDRHNTIYNDINNGYYNNTIDIKEMYRRKTTTNNVYTYDNKNNGRYKYSRRHDRQRDTSYNDNNIPSNNHIILSDTLGISSIHDKSIYTQPIYSMISDGVMNQPAVQILESEVRRYIYEIQSYSNMIEHIRTVCKKRIEQVSKLIYLGTDDLRILSYGSWDTGLSIPGSDIDLLVSTSDVDRELSIKMLELLEENLNTFTWVSNLKNITTAQIPVLKASIDTSVEFTKKGLGCDEITDDILSDVNIHIDTDMKDNNINYRMNVDIIVETPDITALQTTKHVKDSVSKWPELKPLVLLLKYFLSRRGLTNPFTGRYR